MSFPFPGVTRSRASLARSGSATSISWTSASDVTCRDAVSNDVSETVSSLKDASIFQRGKHECRHVPTADRVECERRVPHPTEPSDLARIAAKKLERR